MLNVKPQLGDPSTLLKLAQLPGCGQAAALIRRVDPLWGMERDRGDTRPVWTVYISKGEGECPHCHCDCNSDLEEDKIEVVAYSEEEAKRKANRIMDANKRKYGGFDIESIAPPRIVEAPVPESIEELFETPEARAVRMAEKAVAEAYAAKRKASAMSTGTVKTAQPVEGQSPASAAPQGETPK